MTIVPLQLKIIFFFDELHTFTNNKNVCNSSKKKIIFNCNGTIVNLFTSLYLTIY